MSSCKYYRRCCRRCRCNGVYHDAHFTSSRGGKFKGSTRNSFCTFRSLQNKSLLRFAVSCPDVCASGRLPPRLVRRFCSDLHQASRVNPALNFFHLYSRFASFSLPPHSRTTKQTRLPTRRSNSLSCVQDSSIFYS